MPDLPRSTKVSSLHVRSAVEIGRAAQSSRAPESQSSPAPQKLPTCSPVLGGEACEAPAGIAGPSQSSKDHPRLAYAYGANVSCKRPGVCDASSQSHTMQHGISEDHVRALLENLHHWRISEHNHLPFWQAMVYHTCLTVYF